MIAVISTTEVRSVAPSLRSDAGANSLEGVFNLQSTVQAPPPPVVASNGSTTSSGYSVLPNPDDTWSNTREFRFSKLASKRALGEASVKEQKEFDSLLKQRRRARNPPSTEEVLFQYKRRQIETKLLLQLQEYANFIDAPRSA